MFLPMNTLPAMGKPRRRWKTMMFVLQERKRKHKKLESILIFWLKWFSNSITIPVITTHENESDQTPRKSVSIWLEWSILGSVMLSFSTSKDFRAENSGGPTIIRMTWMFDVEGNRCCWHQITCCNFPHNDHPTKTWGDPLFPIGNNAVVGEVKNDARSDNRSWRRIWRSKSRLEAMSTED